MVMKGGYALMLWLDLEQDIKCREENISFYIVHRENRT
jgi:hypothetical protein